MSSDKTEEPTPKRLRKAQEEGDSPISTFASQSVAFLAAVAVAPAAITAVSERAGADLRAAVARAGDPSIGVRFDPASLASSVVLLSAPILAAAAVASAVASVVQSGGVIATKKLTPKLERLDLVKGLQGLFSPTRLVAIARAALFGAGVTYFATAILRDHAPDFARSTGRMSAAAMLAGVLALAVVKRAAILGLFLAVLDVVVTRSSWRKKLMMSKAEVKREHKESEGDPQLKAARERAHHELLAAATIGNVRHATVVVVNPTHIACALRYDEEGGDEAPVVVSSGEGDMAARIVEAARRYGVPVLRDVPLARALVELEIGTAIPEALYEAVAEILREAWEEADHA
ncbi:MAG: EscU/YscU/HrcU family type III secretion system export apparatus switch protein [Deltaproteobacteria bacterium]|nr:EscU/YscU/HrcU family type III secretion system export apparatus switch protein [Deltaproteobacteria bacterium]